MLNLKLEDQLKEDIRSYYITTRISKQMKEEFINFTGNISQHKSKKVSKTVFMGLLEDSPLTFLIRSVIYASVIKEEKMLKRLKIDDSKKLDSLWKRPSKNLAKIMNMLTENIEISYA
jgi:hypothetical protein